MSPERTNAALRFFFETFLTRAQKDTLQRSAQAVEVRLGEYKRYTGTPVPVIGGGTVQPRFALEVSRQTLPLRNGIPDAAGASVGGNPTRVFLLWLRDIADVVADSQAEIERIMHNLDYFVGESGARNAAAWAKAIATHPNRGALKRNLFEYTEVPEDFKALAGDHLGEFRQTLYHFFTFTEDGEYYERWSGAGRTVPGDFSALYKQRQITEFPLTRYDTYLYSVVPTSFLTVSPPPEAPAFREIVWGFLWGGEDGDTPTGVRVLHTVDRAAGEVGDYFDFVCFEAEEGLGVAMRPSARSAIDEGLANFLGELPEDATERARVIRASSLTTDHAQPLVKMFATIRGNPQLPEGVLSLGSGEVRTLLVPPDKVEDVAALSEVDETRGPRRLYPRLTEVAKMVRKSALDARIAAAKRGGEGVVVGVIDSGLDAQHPAFAGRVLGVWEQGNATGPAPAVSLNQGGSGFLDAVGDLVRTAFFGDGTEFTGATVTNARDGGAHGTHVTGIAAGAEVTGANPVPPGMAPKARIIVVQTGRPSPDPNDAFSERNQGLMDFDVVTGILYIREKARQFNAAAPVVVNMSFGSHDHAHDRTDSLSRALKNAVMEGSNFIPGLILVASAGNERTDHRHLQRTVAAGGNVVLSFDFTPGQAANRSPLTEVITVWVTNPKAGNTKLDARVRTRRPAPSAVATKNYKQEATRQPDWETKWGDGVHIGTSFGPPDPQNGDFNIRVRFQTALALLPDPSGPFTINVGGTPTKHRLVRLNRDWTIFGTHNDIWTQPGRIVLPLGFTQTGATQTRWEVVFTNRTKGNLDLHVWAGRENAAFNGETAADISHMILSPADSEGVISVASCNSNAAAFDTNPDGALSSFSCPGPLRKKPTEPGIDITAPGCEVNSACSQNGTPTVNPNVTTMSGTSMASPAVAGLIANILAEEPTLTIPQVQTRLARCKIPDKLKDGTTVMPAGLPVSANDWGKGLIDADKLKL